jgi:3-phosphoshikimate 1-carboxyvinyltransferase
VDLTDPRSLPDPYPVIPVDGPLDATVRVPGSKSITNRALVCAALAGGTSSLTGALFADDTEAMVGVLRSLGLPVETDPAGKRITVTGCDGRVPGGGVEVAPVLVPFGATTPDSVSVNVRQSGTTSRFVLPLLALGRGTYRVEAHEQMRARPMGETFEALRSLGVQIHEEAPGFLPVTLHADGLRAATKHADPQATVLRVAGDASSQFLSGLLLVGPCVAGGLTVELTTELVSRPYVDLTLAVMEAFGARVDRPDDRTFVVAPTGYVARTYAVEPDASAASYPLAAAAICGGRVKVEGLTDAALQGDAAFADVLAAMGATVTRDATGTEVRSAGPGTLSGGTFDLTHLSDTAQTLAVVAPFATSPVTVTGIGFIRRKETDRIAAVATELARCGIDVTTDDDGWTIHPGRPRPATVQTYEDHRMAMSFALLGLAAPGIAVADPACVAKTFPTYWHLLADLRDGS